VALDQGDVEAAQRWAGAVRAALLAVQADDDRARRLLSLAEGAIARLEEGCR